MCRRSSVDSPRLDTPSSASPTPGSGGGGVEAVHVFDAAWNVWGRRKRGRVGLFISTVPTSRAVQHGMTSRRVCIEPMENASPPSVLGKRAREDNPDETAQGSPKLFQCGDCRKSYSRVDHLARHVRLHTKVSVLFEC